MMEDISVHFKVYIGGISKPGEERDLGLFFSQFGDVDSVERVVKRYAKGEIEKSFYVLTTQNHFSYVSILRERSIVYKGRKLFCNKFMEGTELLKHNEDLNQRRFLVKYVPKHFSEQDLQEFIEVFCKCPVEKIYRLENDYRSNDTETNSDKNNSGFHFRSYGLLFKYASICNQLQDVFTLKLKGKKSWYILIQRFYYKKYDKMCSVHKNKTRKVKKTPKQYASDKFSWNQLAEDIKCENDTQNKKDNTLEENILDSRAKPKPSPQCIHKFKPTNKSYFQELKRTHHPIGLTDRTDTLAKSKNRVLIGIENSNMRYNMKLKVSSRNNLIIRIAHNLTHNPESD